MRNDEISTFRAVELLVCPGCGRRYPAGVRFCASDGRELVRESVREAPRERADDPLVGTQVGGYRIDRSIGGGGSGRVYAATQLATGLRCAVKILHQEIAREEESVQRFRREAANHARIAAHPHVCALLDVGATQAGLVYLAMEYVDGETLRALLDRERRLAPARAAAIVRQTASALAAAHEVGLVHRDLKPDNIMLARRADGADHAVLIDFGIAKRPQDAGQRLTRTGMSVGTPQFMSPEQLGAERVDSRCDVYSLGLVAFVMLAGALPFPARGPQGIMLRLAGVLQTLAAVEPSVAWPAAMQRCLDRALALDAGDRHATVTELAAELSSVVERWESGALEAEHSLGPDVGGSGAAADRAEAAGGGADGGEGGGTRSGGWLGLLGLRGRGSKPGGEARSGTG